MRSLQGWRQQSRLVGCTVHFQQPQSKKSGAKRKPDALPPPPQSGSARGVHTGRCVTPQQHALRRTVAKRLLAEGRPCGLRGGAEEAVLQGDHRLRSVDGLKWGYVVERGVGTVVGLGRGVDKLPGQALHIAAVACA